MHDTVLWTFESILHDTKAAFNGGAATFSDGATTISRAQEALTVWLVNLAPPKRLCVEVRFFFVPSYTEEERNMKCCPFSLSRRCSEYLGPLD